MPDTTDQSTENEAPLCYSSEEARTVLDSLSAHIAIMDASGVILDTNRAWRDFAVKGGMPKCCTMTNKELEGILLNG